jgi:hypothetical protein
VATTRVVAPTLADEQVGELLDLIGDADSVELKLTVPESQHFSTARALGIDPLDAQIRQVFFFDTPKLELNKRAWWCGRGACSARAAATSS